MVLALSKPDGAVLVDKSAWVDASVWCPSIACPSSESHACEAPLVKQKKIRILFTAINILHVPSNAFVSAREYTLFFVKCHIFDHQRSQNNARKNTGWRI